MVQRRKRLLDVATVLDGAVAVIDRHGGLTMAALAAELGTSASAVYHHVKGRAEIVELLRERVVVNRMVVPTLDGTTWAREIERWMRSYRAALAEHPNLIRLLAEHTMTAGPVLRGYDRVAEMLRRAGVPAAEVLLWISVFDSYALGSALDLAAPADGWRGGGVPALDEALSAAPRGRPRADQAFEIGLAALLAGLEARLARGA